MDILADKTQHLLKLYYSYYPNMKKIPVKMIITDNMENAYCNLRADRMEKVERSHVLDDYNGLMVVPNSVDDEISILINSNSIVKYTNDSSMTWVGTIAHELTHAIDFYQMARREKLKSYYPLENTGAYFVFQSWSEYHARRLGYRFLRNYLGVDESPLSQEEHISYILRTEWPFHINQHYKVYHATNDGDRQIYSTMQWLGRYSVWCDLFPNSFNENLLAMAFNNSPWMGRLFSFLRHHETFEEIDNHFIDMRVVLQENWPSCPK